MKKCGLVGAALLALAVCANAWENDFKDTDKTGLLNLHPERGALLLNNVAVTVTAAELNALDGITATAAELNILDGATLDVTELNGLDISGYVMYVDDFFTAGYLANAAANLSATNALVIQRGGNFSEVADHADWLVTVTDGDGDNAESIVVLDDAPGGWLRLETNNKADDSLNVQMNGESFKITSGAAGKDVWFEAKFEVEDVDKDNVFIGLSVADTDFYGSLPNDYIGFFVEKSTNVVFKMAKNGVTTTNTMIGVIADYATAIGTSAVRCGFYADASTTNCYVYFNGTLVTNYAANATIPNDEALSPLMYIETSDTGADFLDVDYIRVIQSR
jgi:hypothetical protein